MKNVCDTIEQSIFIVKQDGEILYSNSNGERIIENFYKDGSKPVNYF